MSVDPRRAAADRLEMTNLALTILHDCRRSSLATHACSLSSSTTSTLSAPEPFCVLRALLKREVLREKFKWKIKSNFFLFTRDIIFPTFLSTYAIFNVSWKQALRLSASVKTFLIWGIEQRKLAKGRSTKGQMLANPSPTRFKSSQGRGNACPAALLMRTCSQAVLNVLLISKLNLASWVFELWKRFVDRGVSKRN